MKGTLAVARGWGRPGVGPRRVSAGGKKEVCIDEMGLVVVTVTQICSRDTTHLLYQRQFPGLSPVTI